MKKSRIFTVAVLLAVFCVLTAFVYNSSFIQLETDIYSSIAKSINPEMTKLMIAITKLGSATALITAMVVFLALPSTRIKIGIPVVLTVAVTAVSNLILKVIVARPRPEILRLISETGYGFPSGHSMNNAAFYAALVLIVFAYSKNIRLRVVAVAFGMATTFLIGVSRIYLGVHSVGDVLAGWAMGVAVALCVDTLCKLFSKNKSLN